ncbi:MAG: ATP-binding protein [Sphingomicrobium sp.]
MRLIPRSLIGQMAVLLGVALMVAQLVNFALILNERQKLSLAQNQGPAITRFVSTAADVAQAVPEYRSLVAEDSSRRGARYSIGAQTNVPATATRDTQIASQLRDRLAENDVRASDIRAAFGREQRRTRNAPPQDVRVLLLSVRQLDGNWLNASLTTPPADRWLSARLGAATLLLYLIVLGASLFIALRLARPLGDLARAADRFEGRGLPDPVVARGPTDLRRAIEAFNAMNGRVVSLLDEKDRMLGAIGHDLRTPLASLRIRAENVEPADDRAQMIATIEQMAAILEDILVLARTGHASEESREMDLTALADSLVEEYRDLGRHVAMMPSPRVVATIQPNLMRRAIRNLVDNAVTYGGSATVAVESRDGRAIFSVSDPGPGLADDQLESVLDPFTRVEHSRNRDTGGSGLGLAIAKAVAVGHGGDLTLRNGPERGLVACLSVPVTA